MCCGHVVILAWCQKIKKSRKWLLFTQKQCWQIESYWIDCMIQSWKWTRAWKISSGDTLESTPSKIISNTCICNYNDILNWNEIFMISKDMQYRWIKMHCMYCVLLHPYLYLPDFPFSVFQFLIELNELKIVWNSPASPWTGELIYVKWLMMMVIYSSSEQPTDNSKPSHSRGELASKLHYSSQIWCN